MSERWSWSDRDYDHLFDDVIERELDEISDAASRRFGFERVTRSYNDE